MATSYTGLRVQDTYNAIIKIGDNSNLTGTPKLLSDGLGNDSPLYLSGTRLGIGITPAYQFHTSGNAKIGGNLIISGNLTVNGTLTYLNVEDLQVEDPLIKLAKDNTSNTLDIGFFGKYVESATTKYTGLFWDASTDKFRLYEGLQVEPTTTVDVTGTGYTRSLLNADLEGNVIGTVSSLSNHDTNDLVEGSVNQYFTTARARASFSAGDGITITNGVIASEGGSADTAKRIEITVKNVSGSNLVKGAAVHASPTATPPSGNVIEVIGADNDVSASMPAIGILNEAIADEAEGQCVMVGSVTGINTSSFTAGEELYVGSTAGVLTNTKPTSTSNQIQKIAVVIKSHASNGQIEVFGAGRANDVPNLVDRTIKFTPSIDIDGGTGYGRIEIGGDSGGYVDLKAPYSDDYDLRLITSSGGSEVTAVSTLNLSSASGQIALNSGISEIHLLSSGTTFGKLFKSGNDFFINNPTLDEDIIFSGNDGGTAISALILDMSENGEATFSGNIGIGVTPEQKLHSYISTGDIYNLIETGSNVSTAGSRYKSSSKEYFAGLQYSVSSAYQIYDITEGEARMTIDTAGATTFYKDVSISNSATHSYLSIDAANVSASEAGIFLKIGGTTKWEIYTAANDGNFSIYSQAQGIKLFITPTGDASFDGTITATKDSQAQAVFQGWSSSGANGSSGAIRLGGNSSYQGRIDYAADGNTQFLFDNTYATGLYKFSIAGTPELEITTSGLNVPGSSNSYKTNGYQLAKYSYFGYSTGYPGIVIGNTGGQSLFFNVDPVGNPSGSFNGGGMEYVYRNVGSFITPNASNNGYNTILGWNTSGGVTFSNGTTFNGDVTITGNLFLPTASSYIKLGGYSFIGEDLIDNDSLTIASHYTESIYFAHENSGVYTTTMRIDPSGNLTVGNPSYGSSLGQVRIINNGATAPASLSLFGYNNITDNGNYAKIDLAMQTSGTGGNVVSSIRGLAVGVGENSSDLAFYNASGGTLGEKMRITHDGRIALGTTTDIDGRIDFRMNFSGQNWIPDNTSAKWSEVWCNAGTPGTYFNDVMLHLNTNRGGGATGGVVGIAFSPGWGGHQNWGIYSFNNTGSSYTSGVLAFVSQLNDGTRIERMRLDGPTGNVGIGNFSNTPQAKLHIDNGTLYVNAVRSDTKLTGSVSSETSANLYGSQGYWGIRTALNNSINFDTYNSGSPVTPLTILQGGNVGISINNPGYTFTVLKPITNDWLALFGNTYNGAGNGVLIDAGNGISGEILRLRDKDGNHKVSFLSNGNVGINNLSPAKKLEISSGTDGDGILLTGTGGFASGSSRNIEFSYNDTDTSYASAIKFEVANSALNGGQVSIWTDNASGTSTRAMTVDKSQSVGINTTSIKGKLDVYRAAGQSGTAAIAITNGEGGGGRNWGISTEVVRSGDFAILQSTTNGGVPTPSSANTKLYIHPSGYVGIQTTLPTTPLQIHSTNSGQPTIPVFLVNESISLNTEVRLGFAANTNNDVASNRYSYISTINTTGSNGQAMVFATNESGSSAVQRMYIKSSGNVGVNTSNPSAKLHTVDDGYSLKTSRTTGASENLLIGNKAAAGIIGTTYPGQIVSSGNNIFEMYTDAGKPLVLGTNSTHRIYISAAGRVGLGTTNPSTLLSLQSTLNNSLGGISLIGNSPGDKSNIWTQDIYSKWLHTENAGDAANGYGRIDFETNAAVNATYPTRGGFSFKTAGAGQFVTFTNQGRVGINITTPSERLSIKGANQSVEEILRVRTGNSSYSGAGASLGVAGYEGEMNVYDSANVKRIYLSSHYNCYINPKGAGLTAIGKTTASYTLDVDGTIRATSDVIAFSDRRVKENIITVNNALEKVTKLRGVTYTRKDTDDKSTKIGVIAQEVLEVLPEVVEKDDEGMYSVAYGNMAGVFIEAIKELKAEVDSLKQEIKELKK